ncbi:MAG: hypothetical protein ACRDNA_02530 [Gaiellaceae bacterium]
MGSDLVDGLFERARSAAFADDAHRRGWEAVRTAALLRRDGRHDMALDLLDDVVARFRYEDVEIGAYTCAVAIHCDRGDPVTALAVGRPLWDRGPSVELGHALVRAYWEHFKQTGLLDDRDDWLAFKDELDAVQEAAL